MRLSNAIAEFLNQLLEEENVALIQRNEIATTFNCVPSQINYVIATRFTPERGYIVESRRGGGGYIKITRVYADEEDFLTHVLMNVGQSIDEDSSALFIEMLCEKGIISSREAEIINVALSDKTLAQAGEKNQIRAKILKNIILTIM